MVSVNVLTWIDALGLLITTWAFVRISPSGLTLKIIFIILYVWGFLRFKKRSKIILKNSTQWKYWKIFIKPLNMNIGQTLQYWVFTINLLLKSNKARPLKNFFLEKCLRSLRRCNFVVTLQNPTEKYVTLYTNQRPNKYLIFY